MMQRDLDPGGLAGRGLDWKRPFRVLRLARQVGISPWEALAWLESVLADFEAQSADFGDGSVYASGDGLPWPPDE